MSRLDISKIVQDANFAKDDLNKVVQVAKAFNELAEEGLLPQELLKPCQDNIKSKLEEVGITFDTEDISSLEEQLQKVLVRLNIALQLDRLIGELKYLGLNESEQDVLESFKLRVFGELATVLQLDLDDYMEDEIEETEEGEE